MTSEEDIVRAFMPCPGQHANYERCPIDIDGEHDLAAAERLRVEKANLEAAIVAQINQIADLKVASRAMLQSYVDLANSGDAGFWDPEKEPEVIALRNALNGGSEGAQ